MSELRRPNKRQKRQGLAFTSIHKEKASNNYPEADFNNPCDQAHSSDQYRHAENKDTSIIEVKSSPATPSAIKTRILLISDTHGKSKLLEELHHDQKIDVLIHTGDLSDCGSLADYQATLSLMSRIPADLKLVIPGNHDLTLDKDFWESRSTLKGRGLSEEARSLFECKEMRKEGVRLLGNGTHEFRLKNGGLLRVYAGAGTPYPEGEGEGTEWAFGYPSNTDIYNPLGRGICYAKQPTTPQSQTIIADNADIDIMMTHGPPKYRLDHRRMETGGNQERAMGCPHLFRAVRRARPKLHVFGHVHSGNGAEVVQWEPKSKNGDKLPDDDDIEDGIVKTIRLSGMTSGGLRKLDVRCLGIGREEEAAKKGGDKTLFVNAALMGASELENLPWMVELDLQRADSKTDWWNTIMN